jgi:hypothetical protein
LYFGTNPAEESDLKENYSDIRKSICKRGICS